MTLVGEGEHIYEWVEDWAGVPDSENARTGWAHPGMVVTDAGYIKPGFPRSNRLSWI